MMSILLMFLQVNSTIVKYRFSLNFGKHFWDYSGNNNHGINDNGVIRSTDRGVYLASTDSRIQTPDDLALPVIVSYLAWIMPTDSEFRIIYRVNGPSSRYQLCRKASTNAVYIHVDYSGQNHVVYGPDGSFPSGVWSLAVLSHDGSNFQVFMNGIQKLSLAFGFTTSYSGFSTGLGTRHADSFTSVNGFVWIFIIMSGLPNYSNFISASSSNCLVPGTSLTCSISIIDESLGAGCLSTEMNSLKNSFGISCADTSTGCSVNTVYSCSSTTIPCIYDRVSNNCYLKSTTFPYTETQVACSCQTGYSSTNNQCCRSDCSYCDKTGFCTSCKSLNSYISSGVCNCSTNYYGTLPLTNVDSCCLKGLGCSICSLTNPCTACVDSNAFISGTSCLCNYGYYQSGINTCSACNFGCKTCVTGDLCTSCWDLKMSEISSNVCECQFGYYASTAMTCSPCNYGCKQCSSSDLCTLCWDALMIEQNNICSCQDGYYDGPSNNCIPCSKGCKKCTISDSCTLCWDSLMIEENNICLCKDGYYDGPSNNCLACGQGCKKCDSLDPCLLCWDSLMNEQSNTCLCQDGYYNGPNNNCVPCGQGCKKCDASDQCLLCWDTLMIEQNNICLCQEGYYDGHYNNCVSCGYGCKECSDSYPCISCFDQNTRNDGVKCYCNDGFYEVNSKTCGTCGVGCKTCSSNSCLTCFDSSAKITGTSCICSSGFYMNSLNICDACGMHCETCSSTNQCISCFDMNATNTGTYCKCNNGFYNTDSDHFCHPCKNSCSICEKNYCLECVSENAEIIGDKCICKTGYWSEDEPNKNNSCILCFEECETCNSSIECLTCKSKNASPNQHGCKCDDGFWNNSLLIQQDNCFECNSTCLACQSQNFCTSCKNPQAELNENGECIVLCWKNQSYPCLNCKSLCLECDLNLNCLKCSENAILKKGDCFCIEGFKLINEKCTEQYFYANLTILTHNSMKVSFNEKVITSLRDSDFFLEIDQNFNKFYLKKIDHSQLRLTVLGVLQVNKTLDVKLEILKEFVYSSENSMLFNKVLFGKMKPNTTSDDFLAAAVKPLGQTLIVVSAGIGIMANPAGLWSLINTIQLITFMPINAVPYSKKIKETSSSLMNYNVVPNVLKYISNSDATSYPYGEVKEFGIETSVILLNCGPIWIIFIQCIVVSVFFILLSKCFRNSIKIQNYKEKFKFNLLIRFWIQAYLELAIFGFIQAKAQILIQVEGYLYVCLGFLVSFFVVISPFVLFVTMKNSSDSIQNEEFFISYGSLYDEFLNDRGVYSTLYYPLFLLRRLAYSIVQIFLNSYPAYQAYLNVAATVLVIIYLFYFRPFKDRLVLASTIIGEICILIVFTVSSFFMYTDDQFHIKKIENICIYTVLGTIGIQFLINMLMFYKTLKELWAKMIKARALKFIKSANQMFSQEKIISMN